MDTKNLLSGLIGFFIGGLLVSTAAVTFDKPIASERQANSSSNARGHDDAINK